MPPEAFQRSKPGKSSDIWSFGITILEVLTGKHDTLATTPTEHLLYLPLAIAFKFKLFAMYFSTRVSTFTAPFNNGLRFHLIIRLPRVERMEQSWEYTSSSRGSKTREARQPCSPQRSSESVSVGDAEL